MDKRSTCWILTGPTASGKTAFSIALAHEFGCEIVCMDSMQIYRGLDIGTAKPTPEEQEGIPHHMLDIADPRDSYSVAQYVEDGEKCVENIFSRRKIPLFVGGTGFYLRALRHPMTMGSTPGNQELRRELQSIAESSPDGGAVLHRRLEDVDPDTAARLPVGDVRRVIRALEVFQLTGIPFSQQKQQETEPKFSYRTVTLDMERSILYERIEKRVDIMISRGLTEEVAGLLSSGVTPECQSMKGIGYKEIIPYIEGKCSLDEAVSSIRQNTRHYAKRQLTWMRREENVLWVNAFDKDAYSKMCEWYAKEENQNECE